MYFKQNDRRSRAVVQSVFSETDLKLLNPNEGNFR